MDNLPLPFKRANAQHAVIENHWQHVYPCKCVSGIAPLCGQPNMSIQTQKPRIPQGMNSQKKCIMRVLERNHDKNNGCTRFQEGTCALLRCCSHPSSPAKTNPQKSFPTKKSADRCKKFHQNKEGKIFAIYHGLLWSLGCSNHLKRGRWQHLRAHVATISLVLL